MATETTVRRTFNINNFESLTIEGFGSHPFDAITAHLLATKNCLEKAQQDVIRIFNIRANHGTKNEYDEICYSQITTELNSVNIEINSREENAIS